MKKITFIFFVILLVGCTIIPCKYDYKYFKSYHLNSRIIKTDGYYFCDEKNKLNDSSRLFFIIFRNGTIYKSWSSHSDLYNIEEIIQSMNNPIYKRNWYYSPYRWGNYRIDNDTLKIQTLYPNGDGFSVVWYSILEWQGKILNDTTIQMFNYIDHEDKTSKQINQFYHFRHYSFKPDSINWIMDDKRLNKLYEKGIIGNKKVWESSSSPEAVKRK